MSRTRIFFLITAIVIFSFAFQGFRSVWEPSEGRYVCVATMMLQTDDWMHPLLHAELPHWTKPPMTYWAIAASLQLFGYSEFTVRFPNSMAFLLTILMVFYLGKIFLPRSPWLPPVIYATSLFPFIASNIVTTDCLLVFFETAGMTAFVYMLWKTKDNRL